jgi:cyclopropane fatty-acyl-phospholipid synthase-like methyltransferase
MRPMNLWRKLFFSIYYLRNPPWDTGLTPPEVEEFVQNNPPGRALDLGCGSGTNVIYLAQHGWQAIGVDFVEKAIRLARGKAHQAGVEATFYFDDVTRLREIESQFDLVLDIGCFHSLSERAKGVYVANLSRLLVPNGIFLLYGFINHQNGGNVGLNEGDLKLLSEHLQLVDRQTGKDGSHTSAWLTYRHPLDASLTQ